MAKSPEELLKIIHKKEIDTQTGRGYSKEFHQALKEYIKMRHSQKAIIKNIQAETGLSYGFLQRFTEKQNISFKKNLTQHLSCVAQHREKNLTTKNLALSAKEQEQIKENRFFSIHIMQANPKVLKETTWQTK